MSKLPRILYEDQNILAIEKPTSLASVPLSKSEKDNAVELFLKHHPDYHDKLPKLNELGLERGLLNRLDSETSGILVFAKSQNEFKRLKLLWKTDAVSKIYLAICLKQTPFELPHWIEAPIYADPKSKKKMGVYLPGHALRKTMKLLPARTEILSCESEPQFESFEGLPFERVSLRIYTGVRHQIRVHLAALGYPIYGDLRYFPKRNAHFPKPSRMYLHAWKLSLPDPSGRLIEIETLRPF